MDLKDMSKNSSITVAFHPVKRKIKVKKGTSIFDALRAANVVIRTECGGIGTCGKCKVIVSNKNALSGLTEAEIEHLSQKEIESDYRLACQAFSKQDFEVFIPEESRIGARRIVAYGVEPKMKLDPLVRKFHVKLLEPSLSDVTPDLERLVQSLSSLTNKDKLVIDYDVLKKLPDALRKANWNVTTVVWNNQKIIAAEPGDTSKKLFGFAVDIGTSKIVGYLVDLITGATVSTASIENPQSVHGADIMTRITFAMDKESNFKKLQNLVVGGVNEVLVKACANAGINPKHVYEAAVVGNTAMHHIFLGIQPKYTALSPYVPAVKSPMNVTAKELKIKMSSKGIVNVLPVIAGFVGADAVGDVLATEIHKSDELSLLIDIGTNTEIFVGNSEDILSCSCASGPAFEGAEITHGMKAETGAIERVRITQDLKVEYKTIDNVKPIGLCGSAMIDIVAEMFKRGIIDHQGKFNPQIKTPKLRRRKKQTEFIIAWKNETATRKEITMTQKDIEKIQLAKAAIYSGCSVLMKRKGVKKEDFDRVFIAGAFGSYINPENSRLIGLVPDIPTKKIRFVGNTAIIGAKMVLVSKEARKTAETLSRKVRYIELATDPEFNTEFFAALFLPHKDLSRFPSVKKSFKINCKA